MPGTQAVDRAIAILKAFSPERQELGVMELGRILGLHKSTVSRLLSALERGGLVERNTATGAYRLGVGLIELAGLVLAGAEVKERARPFLLRLVKETQEAVNLVILDGDMVLTVEAVNPGTRRIMGSGWAGRRSPIHCTATGKVLLAHEPAEETERTIARGLTSFTIKSITSTFR